MTRRIIHVDMDEFFAAVEKLDHPELRGKPLLVGGSPTARGVVSTASYEARAFGCHSAMPMAAAIRLCPDAVVLPVRGERYAELSDQVFALLEHFTPLIEPLSIDEAFLDVTGCEGLFGPAEEIARTIKDRIRAELGLTASVGVAPNKFLAKLASDLRKPDGLMVIAEAEVHAVLDPLPAAKLWGLGPASAARLLEIGVRTIGQLRAVEPKVLRDILGDAAEHFLQLANGIDNRAVVPDSEAKSIGREQTFAADIGGLDELKAVLLDQVEQVARRLRRHELRARRVILKLRYGDFTTVTRSATLPEPTDVTHELWQAASALLVRAQERQPRPLRLLGVTASQFDPREGRQLTLFADPRRAKHAAIDRALDHIAERFGDDAIRRAAIRRKNAEEP